MDPSNVAPIASIAPRERALSASVFSSTRRQPQTSNACRSMSSFASTLTPVFHTEGSSQVQPISTEPVLGPQREKARRADDLLVTQCHKGDLGSVLGGLEGVGKPRVELLPAPRAGGRTATPTCAGRATLRRRLQASSSRSSVGASTRALGSFVHEAVDGPRSASRRFSRSGSLPRKPLESLLCRSTSTRA